jgi:hypothetical protein
VKILHSTVKEIIAHPAILEEVKRSISDEGLAVIKGVAKPEIINDILEHLTDKMRLTEPAYQPLEKSCANFYRVNFEDSRSHIKGHFHQFNFFPWNADQFNFFEEFKHIFALKNLLNDLDADKYMSGIDDDFIPKLSFQFYDSGKGYLERHQDPVGEHQFVVPILAMSQKGADFDQGGLEVKLQNEWKIVDDNIDVGDLVLLRGDVPHGVEKIDPNKEFELLSSGRWMGLFAINKLQGSNKIENSKTIETA